MSLRLLNNYCSAKYFKPQQFLKRNLINSIQEEPLKKWMAEKLMSILKLQSTLVHEESDYSDNEC